MFAQLEGVLAMAADAFQDFVFPLFADGALSPADDVLDLAVAAILVHLLGWHWEFLPAFAAELVPAVDLGQPCVSGRIVSDSEIVRRIQIGRDLRPDASFYI